MDAVTKKQLQIKACTVRMGVIEGVFNAKSGHPGGSLSIADILTYLYFEHILLILIYLSVVPIYKNKLLL